MSSAPLFGRTLVQLDPKNLFDATDELYASQLMDGVAFTRLEYKHCTFANISFLRSVLDNCTFVNCAFLDCYFRLTELTSSRFVGCKFEDCTFTELSAIDCTFEFPQFRRCFIAFDEFVDQLPEDPGMRFRIADELAREATASGSTADAREYRLQAEAAYEHHLANIALASGSDYYRTHFEVGARLKAARAWVRRRLNRLLWGYGERGWILVRSFLVVGVLLFPLLFWLFTRDDLHRLSNTGLSNRPLSWFDYELLSFDNLLTRPGFAAVSFQETSTRILIGVEVLVGLLFIGLFISIIFNWMRRR